MDAKKKFHNDPAKFFLYQDRLLTQEERKRAAEYSASVLNLEKCPVCAHGYDLATHAPRILIHCGHTVCTACLYLFFKDQRVRCPMCSKIIKRLRLVEVLPLNHQIFYTLINQLPESLVDTMNSTLKLPSDATEEFAEQEDYEFPLCEAHSDRYKHFACLRHNILLCRACVLENTHVCHSAVVDLYCLRHDVVKDMLARLSPHKKYGLEKATKSRLEK